MRFTKRSASLRFLPVFVLASVGLVGLSNEFQIPNSDNKALILASLPPTVVQSPVVDVPVPETKVAPTNITRVVHRGDTVSSIWSANGAPSVGGHLAARAFRDAGIGVNSLQVGEELHLAILNNDIVGLRRTLKDGRTLVLDGDSDRGYSARVEQPVIFETSRVVSGTIIYSLSESAANLAIPYSVVDDLVDLLSDRIEFRKDLQPGDSFTISYQERRTDSGRELEPGPIEAVSVNTGGKMVVAIRHAGSDNKEYYYDGEGNILGNYFLRYPVQFTRISSMFTSARFHPALKIHRPHNGVDFAAATGTPVRTVADGIVEKAGYGGEGGNMVRIRHDDRYTTGYLHLSKIAAGLRPGSRVSRGQVIGAVGMTGLATGPHLHFSLFDRGAYTDPLKAKLPQFNGNATKIPPTLLEATLRTLTVERDRVMVAWNASRKARA